ncbi:hypothetical protein BHE74_00052397 [Ensete ventricosum]|nr:hypothetical protein GW17_00021655 [Ensete ventricosum]RWW42076.1 hypothetical protein BHE74_00052397 [Ensete ventricosum]
MGCGKIRVLSGEAVIIGEATAVRRRQQVYTLRGSTAGIHPTPHPSSSQNMEGRGPTSGQELSRRVNCSVRDPKIRAIKPLTPLLLKPRERQREQLALDTRSEAIGGTVD